MRLFRKSWMRLSPVLSKRGDAYYHDMEVRSGSAYDTFQIPQVFQGNFSSMRCFQSGSIFRRIAFPARNRFYSSRQLRCMNMHPGRNTGDEIQI